MLSVSIRKKLGDFQLDVSFEAENETMAILGASGCGKSITLKCIAGIEKPDSGRIILNGRTLFDSEKKINVPPQKRHVGYLFQQYALFPNMTLLQNIAAGSRRPGKAARLEQAAHYINLLKLQGLEDKYPHQLSGGQQQCGALARILANEPEVLLLDEPFSALDSYLKWELELELYDILAAYGGTVVFVSHNRDEVYRLCSSVCVLSDGRAEEKLPVSSLFASPRTLASCILSGCKNFSRVERRGESTLFASDWGVLLHTASPVPEGTSWIGVRAHYIAPVCTNGENVIKCKVQHVIDNLFSIIVMVSTPGGESGHARLRLEMDREKWADLGEPTELFVHIAPDDIMCLRDSQ